MEATVINQERVVQGYLDVLLSGAEPAPLRQSVGESSRTPTGLLGKESADSAVIAAGSVGTRESAAIRFEALKTENGCSPYIPIQPLGVAGLKLALDRRLVAEITKLPEAIGGLSRANGDIWLTTLEQDGRHIHVLDTAALVVPATHAQREAMLARCRYTHLVFLTELPVALAVENTDEEIVLPLNQVRWRNDRGAYPWLAATLPSFGYALIDPAGLPPLQA